jgi:hypothetical protein
LTPSINILPKFHTRTKLQAKLHFFTLIFMFFGIRRKDKSKHSPVLSNSGVISALGAPHFNIPGINKHPSPWRSGPHVCVRQLSSGPTDHFFPTQTSR